MMEDSKTEGIEKGKLEVLSNLLKKGNPFFTLEIFSTIKLNTIKTIINNNVYKDEI